MFENEKTIIIDGNVGQYKYQHMFGSSKQDF